MYVVFPEPTLFLGKIEFYGKGSLLSVILKNKFMETIELTRVTKLAILSSLVTNLAKSTISPRNHREVSRNDPSRNFHVAIQRIYDTIVSGAQRRVQSRSESVTELNLSAL
ncbi:hypothetical protein TNCV_3972191 [Trichonephila clavipes]|nr:hypothetical protein TNCV_3972191 [Trichonephila clavipes]